MPVRKKLVAVLDSLGEFAIAIVKHWFGFMSGGVVMAGALVLYERFVRPIPNAYYAGTLLVGFFVASFLAWRAEHAAIPEEPEITLFFEATLSRLPRTIRGVDFVYEILN